MSFFNVLTKVLWICPLVLQSCIVWIMLSRRAARIFPVFFTYTAVVLSREVILLFLKYPGNAYAFVYWTGESLAVLLGLGVIAEVVWHVFRPVPSLSFVTSAMIVLAVIVSSTAALLFFLTRGGPGADRVLEGIVLAERSARFLQACLLIALIALMSRLGLTWRSYATGIVAGFGIYASIALVAFEFRAHLNLLHQSALALINSAAYNAAAFVWALYFFRAWKDEPLDGLPRTDLAEWSSEVRNYVNRWYRQF